MLVTYQSCFLPQLNEVGWWRKLGKDSFHEMNLCQCQFTSWKSVGKMEKMIIFHLKCLSYCKINLHLPRQPGNWSCPGKDKGSRRGQSSWRSCLTKSNSSLWKAASNNYAKWFGQVWREWWKVLFWISPLVSAQLQPKATGTLGFLKHLDFEKWLETKLLVLKLLDYLKSSKKKYRYKSIDIWHLLSSF